VSEAFSSTLGLGAAAFAVALTGAMAPGPYLTVTITRTIQRGRLSAFLMLVGHAALEGALLIGFAFGLQEFLKRDVVSATLSLLGGAFLLWMGTTSLVGAVRGSVVTDLEAVELESRMGPVVQGALVSLSNPYWTLWWVTIGAALAAKGLAIGATGVLSFYVGHELGDIAWYAAVIVAVSSGRHLLSPRNYRIVIGALAVFLLLLGVRFLVVGAQGLV